MTMDVQRATLISGMGRNDTIHAGFLMGGGWMGSLGHWAVIPAAAELALIVVDGYVDLDPAGLAGLGAHVRAEYGVPVIGVAKTAFRTATHAAAVFRGQSRRPLYVTAAGISVTEAAAVVSEMAGRFRLPDAVKLADRLARGA